MRERERGLLKVEKVGCPRIKGRDQALQPLEVGSNDSNKKNNN